ncbi:MAG: ABC transporter six-transmembrane domain-containing protein [Pseudomonadota bacterium]
MTARETLFATVKPFRWRLAFTYAILLMETGFEVFYPFTLGLAINGLLTGDGLVSVLPFAATWLAHILSATFRQMYDTRLFARIYGLIAGNLILRQKQAGAEESAIAARSAMAREAIDFFEFEIPEVVHAIVGLLGGIALLYVYDVIAGLVMTFILGPIYLLYRLYGGRSLLLSRRLNNRLEREVTVIRDGRAQRVRSHFKSLARWRIMLSDLQAWVWALADMFIFVAVLLILYRLTLTEGVTAGAVFAGLSYALNVSEALDRGPVLIEQISRLVDIRRRVDSEL